MRDTAVTVDRVLSKRSKLRLSAPSIIRVDPWRFLTTPAIFYLIAFYVVPIVLVVFTSFTTPSFGLANFKDSLSAQNLMILARTLGIAAFSTVIVAILGYPVAYAIYRTRGLVQKLLLFGVIAPHMTSLLIRVFAWQVLLGRLGLVTKGLSILGVKTEGLLQTWPGLAIGMIQVIMPLFVLPLVAVMHQVDNSSVEAGRSLGGGPGETFWRVFVPQTLPGINVGMMLSFVTTAGYFVMPVILGGNRATMTGVLINTELNQFGEWGGAAATAVILAFAIFLGVALLRLLTSRSTRWIRARGGGATSPVLRVSNGAISHGLHALVRALDRRGWTRHGWPLFVPVILLECYMFLPQLITFPVAFSGTQTLVFPPKSFSLRWFQEFGTWQWMGPLLTSLIVAPVGAVLATLLGGLAAVGIARETGGSYRKYVPVLLLAPMIVPIVVVAVGFYLTLYYLRLDDTVLGLTLVESTLAIPICYVVCRAGMESLDLEYERAARSMGASITRVLSRIILPLIRPAVLVALLFAFLLIFDEVTVPIFVTSVNVNVLPKQMYASIVYASDPTIAVAGAVLLVVSAAMVFVTSAIDRRNGSGAAKGGLMAWNRRR